MYNRVFISHSRDDPNLDFFHKVFSGTNTKSIWAEFEDIEPPPAVSIRNDINRSDALFVLLSNELLKKSHTANWVSFEIGLAANRKELFPLLQSPGMDVYVFEPIGMPINYVVPYCTYYMLYSGTEDELKFLKEMITFAPLQRKGRPARCGNLSCQAEFRLLSNVASLNCPVCKTALETSDRGR